MPLRSRARCRVWCGNARRRVRAGAGDRLREPPSVRPCRTTRHQLGGAATGVGDARRFLSRMGATARRTGRRAARRRATSIGLRNVVIAPGVPLDAVRVVARNVYRSRPIFGRGWLPRSWNRGRRDRSWTPLPLHLPPAQCLTPRRLAEFASCWEGLLWKWPEFPGGAKCGDLPQPRIRVLRIGRRRRILARLPQS